MHVGAQAVVLVRGIQLAECHRVVEDVCPLRREDSFVQQRCSIGISRTASGMDSQRRRLMARFMNRRWMDSVFRLTFRMESARVGKSCGICSPPV